MSDNKKNTKERIVENEEAETGVTKPFHMPSTTEGWHIRKGQQNIGFLRRFLMRLTYRRFTYTNPLKALTTRLSAFLRGFPVTNRLKALTTRLFRALTASLDRDLLGEKAQKFCRHLQAIGVDARIFDERYTFGNPRTREIWIAITGEPIQRIVIREVTYLCGDNSDADVHIEYCVKDSIVAGESYRFTISTVQVMTFAVVGMVVDLRWHGSDCGTGVTDQLQGDMSIKQAIMKSGDITICAGGWDWTISPRRFHFPSDEEWNCYQAIARHLLAIKALPLDS